jgi:Putative porin
MMKKTAVGALVVLLVGARSSQAQGAGPDQNIGFHLDGLFRQEWTRDILNTDLTTHDEHRTRGRLRPRLELGGDTFRLGVGGDFNYSSDENDEPKPALIRDNYRSRDARVDLAFARIRPTHWVRLEGGRFEMPLAFTEMIWDRDLRPQGGAAALELHDLGATLQQVNLTVLGARGSHVFDDDHTNMVVVAAEGVFSSGPSSRLHLMGAFLKFTRVRDLETMIRRQNTRVGGVILNDYRIVDLVARYGWNGSVPVQLVADYCWNTALDQLNHGLWLAAALGSLQKMRVRGEYTYAKVDRDATVAAYATDDFFWSTGWEGHRVDLGSPAGKKASTHAIAQLQKFKDGPRPEDRDHWVKRLRLELRFNF